MQENGRTSIFAPFLTTLRIQSAGLSSDVGMAWHPGLLDATTSFSQAEAKEDIISPSILNQVGGKALKIICIENV